MARRHGFQVFAETGTFDLLLVVTEQTNVKGFRPGDQIGVQAKLMDNVEVLFQALPRSMKPKQPHFYATLTPFTREEFKALGSKLRITTISGMSLNDGYMPFDFERRTYWYRQQPASPCWVPPCEVPELKAGVAGPVQLTKWKADAIRLCMRAVERGFVTKLDFEELKLSMPRWLAKQWIKGTDFVKVNGRRLKRYELVDENKPPHIRYGAVADAMEKAGVL